MLDENGALCEFVDDDFVVRNNLFMVPSSHVAGRVEIRHNPVDLVVLMYAGPLDRSFKPVDQDDVAPHGWMTIKDMSKIVSQNQGGVRKFARDIVDIEASEQLVGKAAGEFSHIPLKRIPLSTILPFGFSSLIQFHKDREKRAPDVRVFEKNGTQNK